MFTDKLIAAFVCLTALACSEKTNYSGRTDPQKEKNNGTARTENATTVVQPSVTPSPSPSPTQAPAVQSPPMVVPYGQCESPCTGAEKVFFNSRYSKWVKVVLCSSSRYDILMSETQTGAFYKVGDDSGHGQDHCELVNNSFSTLASDDDVKSGNCPTCAVFSAGSVTNLPEIFGTNIYYRSKMGDPFTLGAATRSGIHTSCWYECGVSF